MFFDAYKPKKDKKPFYSDRKKAFKVAAWAIAICCAIIFVGNSMANEFFPEEEVYEDLSVTEPEYPTDTRVTIIFDTGSGGSVIPSVKLNPGESVSRPSPDPTRAALNPDSHYVFVDWYLDALGPNNPIPQPVSFPFAAPWTNRTLYAFFYLVANE
jgi:hypothetical protein